MDVALAGCGSTVFVLDEEVTDLTEIHERSPIEVGAGGEAALRTIIDTACLTGSVTFATILKTIGA